MKNATGKTPQIKRDYKILKKLDAGGMGVVYKVMKLATRETMALKVLPPKFAKEEERLTRFKREIMACSRLDHPNLIKIIDSGSENNLHFFTMEFFAGLSLKKMLRRDGPFSSERTVNVALQVARGCSYAHQKSLIHRDLKPDNILLNDKGEIKIIDFGLAKIRDITTMTRMDQALGTTRYLAPEIIQGKPIDSRADIYQMGLIFYELLTGNQVFAGKTPMALIRSYVFGGQPLRSFGFEVKNKNWENLIMNCIQVKTEARYPNTVSLIDDLEKLKNGISVERIVLQERPQNQIKDSDKNKARSPQGKTRGEKKRIGIRQIPEKTRIHKILPVAVIGIVLLLLALVWSIKQVHIQDIEITTTCDSATIKWKTTSPAPSSISYSPMSRENFEVFETKPERENHSLTLKNLEPGERYRFHFRLSGDRQSKQYVFETSRIEFQKVWYIQKGNGNSILSFETTAPVIASVNYPGIDGMQTIHGNTLSRQHSFTLTNLTHSSKEKAYLEILYRFKEQGHLFKEKWHLAQGGKSIIQK